MIQHDDNDWLEDEEDEEEDDDPELEYWFRRAKIDIDFLKPDDLAVTFKSFEFSWDKMYSMLYHARYCFSADCLKLILDEIDRREFQSEKLTEIIIDNLNDLLGDINVYSCYSSKDKEDLGRIVEILAVRLKDPSVHLKIITGVAFSKFPDILCLLLDLYNPERVIEKTKPFHKWSKVMGFKIKSEQFEQAKAWSGKKVAQYIRARMLAEELEK